MPDSTSIHDCERIVAAYDLIEQFPKSVADLFRRHALDETPKSDDAAFVRAARSGRDAIDVRAHVLVGRFGPLQREVEPQAVGS